MLPEARNYTQKKRKTAGLSSTIAENQVPTTTELHILEVPLACDRMKIITTLN